MLLLMDESMDEKTEVTWVPLLGRATACPTPLELENWLETTMVKSTGFPLETSKELAIPAEKDLLSKSMAALLDQSKVLPIERLLAHSTESHFAS